MNIKLSTWAKENSISYLTAYRLFKSNKLPVKSIRLDTGTILVEKPSIEEKVVLYARVSSHDQKEDLDRQLERLRQYAYSNNISINNEYKEIGSGLNPNRKKLNELLCNKSITTIIVEHRERLTRFGFEMLEASFKANGRKIIVIENKDLDNDIVQDMVDILTCYCARIYGKRSAKNKAKKIMEQLNNENN